MPMLHDEEFLARLQRGNRVQIPVLVRWKHRLDAGEVLRVYIVNRKARRRGSFYARVGKDGRFTIPRIIVEELEAEPGDVLKCTLRGPPSKEEE